MEANIAENRAAPLSTRGNVGETKRGIGHAIGFKDGDGADINAY